MPTDRVLIEIVTAANMAGVEEAKAGMLGMNAATLGLAAGLGILIAVGKSAIDNTEAMDKAHLSLQQAVQATNDTYGQTTTTIADTTKQSAALAAAQRHLQEVEAGMPATHKATTLQLMHLADAHVAVTKAQQELAAQQAKTTTTTQSNIIYLAELQKEFDAWAEANKRYIPDQYAAEQALAAFVRAGASAPDAMRELNDALDLSTIRSIDLGSAQQSITLALTGSSKALKVLGISTEEYNAIMKDKLLTTEEKHTALLALIETKTKDGRKAQTDLTQSTQALNKDWQDITTKVGPPLIGFFTTVVGWVDQLVTALKNLGDNKDWNKALSDGMGNFQYLLVGSVKLIEQAINDVRALKDAIGSIAPGSVGGLGTPRGARAAGGPVAAGSSYLVGERGPELFTPGTSGSISPNGGGGVTYNLHIHAQVVDGPALDRFWNEGLRRARFAPGT